MDRDVAALGRVKFAEPEKLNVWQWAEKYLDYSRSPSYDMEFKGPYHTSFVPFMREPMEAITDPDVSELVFWAAERMGKSENMIHVPLRYFIGTIPPGPILYMGAEQTKTEQVIDKRIKRGMALSAKTNEIFNSVKAAGKSREHTIEFPSCDFVASWSNNKQATKGDSYHVIFLDEVSSFPGFRVDTARGRFASVNFPKLIMVSSADPEQRRGSEDDPIIQEWESTDKREWMMPDPITGGMFGFRMGGPDTIDGVKWSAGAKREDGSWDYEAVMSLAHYITPFETRIDSKDQESIVASGRWVATATCHKSKRGYRANRFLMPRHQGTFGEMAVAFLEATRKQTSGNFDDSGRSPLKVFVYQRLAEKYYAQKIIPEVSEVEKRKSAYLLGQRPATLPAFAPMYAGKPASTFITMDVQKDCVWWAVREWYHGGDSSLVDFGQAQSWQEVREAGAKFSIRGGMIDNSYQERRDEVIEAVTHGLIKGMILSYGRDNLRDVKGMPRDYDVNLNRDPYEGTARQGAYRCHSVTFHPDRMKNNLYSLVMGTDQGGHAWRIPQDVRPEYIAQMTSEQSIDGHWTKINKNNHLWDCEVLQLLCAKIFGMYSDYKQAEISKPAPITEPATMGNAQSSEAQSKSTPPKPTALPGATWCPYCHKMTVVNQECKSCRAGVSGRVYADEFGKNRGEDL